MAFDFSQVEQKLQKALDHITQDLTTLRTGKASVQLLDPVMVEAYGSQLTIQELANVSVPDPNLLVIAPWDKNILENIEKAVATAGLNLNPVVDGDIIRIVVPPLTEERRKEMVKILHQKIESGKVMLRQIRTDAKKEIESQRGQSGVSEDDVDSELELLDETVADFSNQLEVLSQKKETELMKV